MRSIPVVAFVLTLTTVWAAPVLSQAAFFSGASIDVPAGQPGTTSGPAGPYPATIDVSGLSAPATRITITLNDVNHTWVGDLDVLLEAPSGATAVIMSDHFSASNRVDTVVADLVLDPCAVRLMPTTGAPVAGVYLPSNNGATDTWDAPAPAGPYSDDYSVFDGLSGTDLNGDWNLWIDDDSGADPGTIDLGWSIGIFTGANPCGELFADGFESGNTDEWD